MLRATANPTPWSGHLLFFMNTDIRSNLIAAGVLVPHTQAHQLVASDCMRLDDVAFRSIAQELRDTHDPEALPEILSRCHAEVQRIAPTLKRRAVRRRWSDYDEPRPRMVRE